MSLSPTFGPRASGPASRVQHSGLGQAVAAFVAERIVLPLERATARRALRQELDALDYRALRDLGINEAGLDGFVATWSPTPKHRYTKS